MGYKVYISLYGAMVVYLYYRSSKSVSSMLLVISAVQVVSTKCMPGQTW